MKKSDFSQNYTPQGYLMNYENGQLFKNDNYVFQFRVELDDIEPAIWRRILVPSHYNFWALHVAIQDAMGWFDYHLHHFEIKAKHHRKIAHIGIPNFEGFDPDHNVFPGWEIPTAAFFNDLGVTAKYLYDYGDHWSHTVQLEGHIYKAKKQPYPQCIDGARACPPEDCGGIYGFQDMLEALSDSSHPEHERMMEWTAGVYDPNRFHKEGVRFDDPYKRWKKAFETKSF
jgi:hypothetical protein